METLIQMSALQLTNQCLANHQQVCHLSSLTFVDKLSKMDIAESFAVQGLQHASVGRDAVAGTVAGGGYPANARDGQASK
jgi:RES domain-containing protein